MICPYCDSPYTRIEPNTDHYTCHSCNRTFGNVSGNSLLCPRCRSDQVINDGEYMRCLSDDCHFTSCVGYENLDPESLEYEQVTDCGQRFQYHTGEKVQCTHCHPIGSIDPPPVTACAFITKDDTVVHFPQSVMYPTRAASAFFQQQMFDIS